MLRTNNDLLNYLANLYNKQNRKENIILKKYSKGEKLLSQNQAATKVMLITSGVTKCYFAEDNDKDYILEFLGKGEIIGEIELIRNISCLCTVEAMTAVAVFAINRSYFLELLKTDLKLNHFLLKSFTDRIINTSTRASYQQLYTVEHSLGKLLKLQSKQDISLSKAEMASYLGITVRSLNRTMKNLNE